MTTLALTTNEQAFVDQKVVFVEKALHTLGAKALEELPDPTIRLPIPLSPVFIADYRSLSRECISDLASAYWGEFGAAHFIVLNPDVPGNKSHPLLQIAEQLCEVLPLRFPVDHPMESHAEARARFGAPDGTLKIYDLDTKDGRTGYREQAETSEQFDAHNDGLGYGGAVEAFMLYADSAPLWGGYTYFQNVVGLSLYLARTDPDSFTALFLPDAITALRPRGKGAIEVKTPVLFLNEHGLPQVFLRVTTGEYKIRWRDNCPPLSRAAKFLNEHSRPFASGSAFVNLSRRGSGCVARNGWVVHGRTRFVNGTGPSETRVLARKWFMTKPEYACYKHVPGMHILGRYADLYPERFGPEALEGHWNYDPASGKNTRKS
jgi:hypothetical protein